MLTRVSRYYKSIFLGIVLCVVSVIAAKESLNKNPEPLVPLEIINKFLNATYTEEEKELIKLDFDNVRNLCFAGTTVPKGTLEYVGTAGAPGACKTTICETFLCNKKNFVYLDPDQRALKFMMHTYYQSMNMYAISTCSSYLQCGENAYTKWRDASNYISNSVLNEAYAKGYNIAHGGTATTPAVKFLYKKLKDKKYHITLLLCSSSDQQRQDALNYRANIQGFVQEAKIDVLNKGKMFSERLPTYFEFADVLHFYWTDDFKKGSILAATYKKEAPFVVHNQEAFKQFVKKYNDDRVNMTWPTLESLAGIDSII